MESIFLNLCWMYPFLKQLLQILQHAKVVGVQNEYHFYIQFLTYLMSVFPPRMFLIAWKIVFAAIFFWGQNKQDWKKKSTMQIHKSWTVWRLLQISKHLLDDLMNRTTTNIKRDYIPSLNKFYRWHIDGTFNNKKNNPYDVSIIAILKLHV